MKWLFDDWNYELGDAQRENSEKMIANRDAIDAEAKPVDIRHEQLGIGTGAGTPGAGDDEAESH